MQNNLNNETHIFDTFPVEISQEICLVQVKSMAGGAGEAERGEFVREVAVLACLEVSLEIKLGFT